MLTLSSRPVELLEEVISELSPLDQDLIGFIMCKQPLYSEIQHRHGLNKTGFSAAKDAALEHMREALRTRGIGCLEDLI